MPDNSNNSNHSTNSNPNKRGMPYKRTLKPNAGTAFFERAEKIALAIIVLYAFGAAIYSNSQFTVEDSAIHAEIANLLKNKGYAADYLPAANIQLTYPPLFHAVSLILAGIFSSGALWGVKTAGAIAVALFPAAIYLLASAIDRKAALFSALSAAVSTNLAIIYILAEFPEILAFDFYAVFLYFYVKKRSAASGIFLGLTALTHPFMGFLAFFSAAVICIAERSKDAAKTLAIGAAIASVWGAQYLSIVSHILSNSWNNAMWYGNAPGFISLEGAISTILRLNILIAFLFAAGFAYFLYVYRKDFSIPYFIGNLPQFGRPLGRPQFPSRQNRAPIVLIILASVTLFFVIYHYTPAQYKFLDVFTIWLALFSGIAMSKILELSQKNRHSGRFRLFRIFKCAYVLFAALLVISAAFPILKINEYRRFSSISENFIGAAEWLKAHDPEQSRIILIENSGKRFKATMNFQSELIFSQISDKIPLDGTISDLEEYTAEYKKQLDEREMLIAALGGDSKASGIAEAQNAASDTDANAAIKAANSETKALLQKYGVKYIIAAQGKCPLEFESIYGKNGVEICEVTKR